MPDLDLATFEHVYRLLALYRSDFLPTLTPSDRRAWLNRAAWDVREAGWGLVQGDDTQIANLTRGLTYDVIEPATGTLKGLRDVVVAEFDATLFDDPVDPAQAGTPAPTETSGPPRSAPVDAPLPAAVDPLLRGLVEHLSYIEQAIAEQRELLPQLLTTLDQILAGYEHRLAEIEGLIRRGYTVQATVLGLPIKVVITPQQAPEPAQVNTVNPHLTPEPPAS